MPGPSPERLWPYGDPGSEGGAVVAGLGLKRVRRVPFGRRPLSGTVGSSTGNFYRDPRRISTHAGSSMGGQGGSSVEGRTLAGARFGALGVTTQPSVPVDAPKTFYAPRPIPEGDYLRVGFFPPLAKKRFVEGGRILTITKSMLAAALGNGPCRCEGDPPDTRNCECGNVARPGDFGAAARLYSAVIGRVVELNEDRCNILGGMFGQVICRESYRGFGPWTVEDKASRIHPAVLNGKVPLFRFKHPDTGDQDWGVYLTVDAPEDAPHGGWKAMHFHVRKISKSWWSRLWDWIKEFVVKVVRFLGELIRDLVQGLCAQAQQLFGRVANAQDGKETLSSTDTAMLQQGGLSPNQINMLVGASPEAAAVTLAVQTVSAKLCKILDDSDKPVPPPAQPAGGGILIAAGIGAGLLFLFLR